MSQRLGQILFAHGSIDEDQLQAGLAYQRAHGLPLGSALVNLQFCTSEQVLAALAAQAGLAPIDLDGRTLDLSLPRVLPRDVAERYRAVPLWLRSGVLGLAVGAPTSREALEDLRTHAAASGVTRLNPFLAGDQALSRAISRLYGERSEAGPTVMLYGWPRDVAGALLGRLIARQVPCRIVGDEQVRAAGPEDIILAPVLEMETLLGGKRSRALLIAASKQAEDFSRAERLAACGFLQAPLDMDCVVRAVQRCHQLLGISPRMVGLA